MSTTQRKSTPAVVAMSLMEAISCAPQPGDVIISIRAHGESAPILSNGWADVLFLEFDDARSLREKERFALKGITGDQADQIARFVEKHRAAAPTIAVHCFMGQSRSVAVAAAIRTTMKWEVICADLGNPYVFSRVCDAFDRLARQGSRTHG